MDILRRVFHLLAEEQEAANAVSATTLAHVLLALGDYPSMYNAREFARAQMPKLQEEGLCIPGPSVGSMRSWRAPGTKGAAHCGGKKAKRQAEHLLRRYAYTYCRASAMLSVTGSPQRGSRPIVSTAMRSTSSRPVTPNTSLAVGPPTVS